MVLLGRMRHEDPHVYGCFASMTETTSDLSKRNTVIKVDLACEIEFNKQKYNFEKSPMSRITSGLEWQIGLKLHTMKLNINVTL